MDSNIRLTLLLFMAVVLLLILVVSQYFLYQTIVEEQPVVTETVIREITPEPTVEATPTQAASRSAR